MKTSSAKAKGRRLQQHVAQRIIDRLHLTEDDVKSLPMGAHGADIWLSSVALEKFPFSVECKNVEKLNVNQAFKQAASAAEKFGNTPRQPLLVHSRNHSEVLATLRLDDFLMIVRLLNEHQAEG